MFNEKFWSQQFRVDFVPATQRVADAFLGRLLPTFSSVEIESEALTQELWDSAMSMAGDPNGPDPADTAEAVQEAGVEHYLGLKAIEQGVLNCCALFLYHLFEQHLMLFHRKELLGWLEQNNHALLNHPECHKRLEASGISARSFASWPKLEELRLLANTLKHGEGRSSVELSKIAPALFTHPSATGMYASPEIHRIYTPLLGDDIFVTPRHVREYAEAIEQFWLQLAAALGAATPSSF